MTIETSVDLFNELMECIDPVDFKRLVLPNPYLFSELVEAVNVDALVVLTSEDIVKLGIPVEDVPTENGMIGVTIGEAEQISRSFKYEMWERINTYLDDIAAVADARDPEIQQQLFRDRFKSLIEDGRALIAALRVSGFDGMLKKIPEDWDAMDGFVMLGQAYFLNPRRFLIGNILNQMNAFFKELREVVILSSNTPAVENLCAEVSAPHEG